jgi:regulator of replication initiation timing
VTKSRIAGRLVEVRHVAHVAELEEVNAKLCTELDAARSKLMEIEHHGQILTFENKPLRKGLECT